MWRCAGARTCHRRTGNARCLQEVEHRLHGTGGVADRAGPLPRAPDVLGLAMIGLDPGEPQPRRVTDLAAQRHGRRVSGYATASHAHIDLQIDIQPDIRLARGGGQVGDIRCIIGADPDCRLACQPCQTLQLAWSDNLVADQHVADAAMHQHLCFRHLLTALAHCAETDLGQRHVHRLVGLRVGAQANARRIGQVLHLPQIAFERVEIDQQGRRINVGECIPDSGGWWLGHGQVAFS